MAQIVTIGGSVAGLATALVLAGTGHDVTVLESDPDPTPSTPDEAWDNWPRRGVAQLRGTHMFLARGLDVLRDIAPDVLDDLRRAGAEEVPVAGFDPGGGAPLTRLACRRTTYEMVLRCAVLRRSSVRFISGANAAGLLAGRPVDGLTPHVTGVVTDDGTTFTADLVVDASGRHTSVATWLGAMGATVPAPEAPAGSMSAYTRWFRLHRPERSPDLVQADLGYCGGVLAPADNAMFSVTLAVFGIDPALKGFWRDDLFMAVAERLPAIAPFIHADVAEPVGGVRFLGGLSNGLRRLTESCGDAEGRPVATGVVSVGDAAMYTNPRFGRGVSLALVHAASLADALDDHDDPLKLATAFGEATKRELEPWYHQSTADDAIRSAIAHRIRAGEAWESIGRTGDDPRVRLSRAMPFAVQVDPVVRTAVLRNIHLLDNPVVFAGNEDVRARAEAVWRELEDDPPLPAGPTYAEIRDIVSGEGAS